MFTFSFGSAFATPVEPSKATQISEQDVRDAINDAADVALSQEAKALSAYVDNTVGAPATSHQVINSLDVTAAAVEKVAKAEVYGKNVDAIEAKRTEMLLAVNAAIRAVGSGYNGYFTTDTTGSATDYQEAGYAILDSTTFAGYDDYQTYAGTASYPTVAGTAGDAYEAKIAKAVFDEAIVKFEKVVSDVNPENYSKDYNGNEKSNYDKVTDLIADANITISNAKAKVAAAADANAWTVVVAQLSDLGAKVYTAGTGTNDPTGTFVEEVAKITKISDEPTEATKLEYAQNKVLNSVVAKINKYLSDVKEAKNAEILEETLKGSKANQTKINEAKEAIATAEGVAANAIEIVTYLATNADDVDDLLASDATKLTARSVDTTKWDFVAATTTLTADGNAYNAAFAKKVVDLVDDLEAEAALLKASVEIDGAEYVAIEDALAKAIDDAYRTGVAVLRGVTPESALYARQEALINSSVGTIKVNDRKYPTVSKWVAALNNKSTRADNNGTYEQKLYDEVRAILSETKSNIRATSSIAEADEAFLAGYAKLDEVLTILDKSSATAKADYQALLKKYKAEIAAYANYKQAGIKAEGSSYNWSSTRMAANLNATLDKAYNETELTAAYEAAKAEIDTLKTKAELAAEKKAIEDKIAAIPTTVAIADRATVGEIKAEIKAYEDYCAKIGAANYQIVTTAKVDEAYAKIKSLEKKAIQDAIDAVGKVTLEDEDAINTLYDTIDEYVAYYTGEDAEDKVINAEYASLVGTKGATLGKTVDDLYDDLEEAKKAEFKAMVAKLPSDGSDVAGIKAARAYYDALSRDAKYSASGVYQSRYYDKLVDLEKILAQSVQALKITAGSTVKKGSITIKWSVKGNAAAADGYQVFRSTKKNSGFGTKPIFTTAKQTYKNTKALKKGTRYYYKVRAYKTVDGKKIYSDWSNKAYRIAK